MCLGPKDNSDEIVAQQKRDEAQRQRKISEAHGRIDEHFDTFSPEFYSGAKKSYLDYYIPQLDDQFGDAREKTVYGLSDQGLLESSVAGERYGDLQETYNKGLDDIKSDAISYRKGLQGNVVSAESDLRNMAEAGASPASIAQQAANRAQYLSQPDEFSPLNDYFVQIAAQEANRRNARAQGFEPRGMPSSLRFDNSSKSSVRNVY